jgi:hypothetical protein
MAMSEEFYKRVERRIEWLTLAVGVAGAAWAAARWGWRSGAGLGCGAIIAWLNFRWLEQGVGALFAASLQTSSPAPRVSLRAYAGFTARMALLVGAVCVILKSRWLPGRAVLAGLFSLIAAVLLEVGYEVATGFREPGAGAGEAPVTNGH